MNLEKFSFCLSFVHFLLQLNAIQGLSYLGSLLSKLESTGMAFSTFLYRCRAFCGFWNFRTKEAPLPHHNRLCPCFQDHPGEPVPEENFWTLWCKRRSTEADTPTIRLGATPSGLTSAHLHHPPPYFCTGQMPFLPPNQQCQSTEGS